MESKFEYDAFLSYSSKDEVKARAIWQKLVQSNLRIFWSDQILKNKLGDSYVKAIQEALTSSKNFIFFASENSINSEWVETECETFYANYHIPNKKERRFIVLIDHNFKSDQLHPFYRTLQITNSIDELRIILSTIKERPTDYSSNYKSKTPYLDDSSTQINKPIISEIQSDRPSNKGILLFCDDLSECKGNPIISSSRWIGVFRLKTEEYNNQYWYSFDPTQKMNNGGFEANLTHLEELPDEFDITFQYVSIKSADSHLKIWIGSGNSQGNIDIFDSNSKNSFIIPNRIHNVLISVKGSTITTFIDQKLINTSYKEIRRKPPLIIIHLGSFSNNQVLLNQIQVKEILPENKTGCHISGVVLIPSEQESSNIYRTVSNPSGNASYLIKVQVASKDPLNLDYCEIKLIDNTDEEISMVRREDYFINERTDSIGTVSIKINLKVNGKIVEKKAIKVIIEPSSQLNYDLIPLNGAWIIGVKSIDTLILDKFIGLGSKQSFSTSISVKKYPNSNPFILEFKQIKSIEILEIIKNDYKYDLKIKICAPAGEESVWYTTAPSSTITGYINNMGISMHTLIFIDKVSQIFFNWD